MGRTRNGPRPISDAIQMFLRETGLGSRPRDARVFAAWRETFGAGLAARATPVAFRRGELLVEVESSALLQELRNFRGDDLRKQANAKLGTDRIRKVVFKLKG